MANTSSSRGYKEVDIANFTCQTQTERFPLAEDDDFEQSQDDSDTDEEPYDGETENDENAVPTIAFWRSNLVALSQRHNLYFAAYQDKLHVTVPRNLMQTLPGKSDLVINLPRSSHARIIGGYINPEKPHCVNNMLVGDLGILEVLLMGCDDGDVLVYYTHNILTAIESKGKNSASDYKIKPFLHENVGKTVWGLALHAASRFIAVSSNKKEVTIFMLARSITSRREPIPLAHLLRTTKWINISKKESPSQHEQLGYLVYNCVKVLELGETGSNIPCISFVSGENGYAISVLAVDITGHLWTLGIWDDTRERLPPINNAPHNTVNMGWGVLVIPSTAFRKCRTPYEAFGMDNLATDALKSTETDGIEKFVAAAKFGDDTHLHFDISMTVEGIPGSSPLYHTPAQHYSEDVAEATRVLPHELIIVDDSNFDNKPEEAEPGSLPSLPSLSDLMLDLRESKHGYPYQFLHCMLERARQAVKPDSTIHLIGTLRVDEATKFGPKMGYYGREIFPRTTMVHSKLSFALPDKSAILRTYQWNVELIPPTGLRPRTICRNILKQRFSPGGNPQADLVQTFERLSMNFCIPELNLIVIATQSGRVALVTLTCVEHRLFGDPPLATMRIDRILPTSVQEEESHRPVVPLMGVAISPIQERSREPWRETEGNRKWRLIMHYYDHSILSYELSRDGEEGLLVL